MIADHLALAPPVRAAARLGILGGSFDPPHRGHLHMARAARRERALDHVLFVPARLPPHKPERELAPPEERVLMLELLLADEPAVSIWSVELERAGPSYSVDTVRALQDELGPGPELHLVIGSDNLPGLFTWHEAPALLELAHPLVVPRPGAPTDPPELERLPPAPRARLLAGVLDCQPVDVSSTELRARLARGEDPGHALPPALREHVLERGVYRAR